MDYKRQGFPLELPPGMQPPQFGNIAITVETWTLPF